MNTDNILKVIINRSIDFRNMRGDDNYYTNFYCLNKLAYIAHGLTLAIYNKGILTNKIYADKTGPYIKEAEQFFDEFDLDAITKKQHTEVIPQKIMDIIDLVINAFGDMSAQDIGIFCKQHKPWLDAIAKCEDCVINDEEIVEYFTNNDIISLVDHLKISLNCDIDVKLVLRS